jgi:hypothetical protein
MRSVDLKILKNKLSEYVRLAASGETVLITDGDRWQKSYRHGRVAALFWRMRGWPKRLVNSLCTSRHRIGFGLVIRGLKLWFLRVVLSVLFSSSYGAAFVAAHQARPRSRR